LSDVNRFAAPSTELVTTFELLPGEVGCWQEGTTLVMTRGVELPDRCIKCNLPAGGYKLECRVSWHPGLVYALLAMGPLIYFVVAVFVSNRATILVGLCELHRKKRKRAITTGWITSLAGLGLLWGAVAFVDHDVILGGILCLTGAIASLFGMAYGVIGPQVCTPKKIDKQLVWLNKIDPSYLASLPLWTERPR
jgi:hypothetical protein